MEEKLLYLIKYLIAENSNYSDIEIPTDNTERFRLYRSLVNIRPAVPADDKFLKTEDEFLTEYTAEKKGITDIADLKPAENGIYLWRGDITTLKCGAIVNAANSGMTGCWQPCHNCIDNCIHTFSGVRLRYKCAEIMLKQGHEEPTGSAKITPAYNLPCDYVIHTVGPIVNGKLNKEHCELLQSSYNSCLEIAVRNNIRSIAFCCISTGVFGFPQREAAEIAVETVRKFRTKHNIEVIFNVFTEKDYEIYNGLLEISRLKSEIKTADTIVIGAGAGLSTAAGFTYNGERFKKYFSDFEEKYGFHDMYSGAFYPFKTPEEMWAYWSRFIYCNRYFDTENGVYKALLELVKGKDYFVITTNVDHQFQKAGFDKSRLFYTQGDYGLFQCSEPCHNATYDNEETVKDMIEFQEDCRIPSDLIPKCPKCGKPLAMNLRSDDNFVEDSGWHKAATRYSEFLRGHKNQRTLFLELGVGYNTPVIIKYPFWQMTAQNPQAVYACVNLGEAVCPEEIREQAICIDGDIKAVLDTLI